MGISILRFLAQCCLALLLTSCGGGAGAPARSHDAALIALALSVGSLAPAFASDTTEYALTVPAGTATITIVPMARDPGAKSIEWRQDSGAPTAVTSGNPTGSIGVPAVGSSSAIVLRVTAADGTTVLQYTITLIQQAPLGIDATLSAITPSVSALIPAFDPKLTDYSLRVPYGTAGVTLTTVATSSVASIKANGAAAALGQQTSTLTLPTDGSQLSIVILVTAEDLTHTMTYTVRATPMSAPDGKVTIYSVGDSTMANYDPAFYPNQRGWGQLLPTFITGSNVSLVNGGVNGTSSKSYYSSALWIGVKSKLRTGDYVFIQFGHNDEKDSGIEGATGIGTDAWGAYHKYLTRFVQEARALGAIPVLVTPVVRLSFSGATVSPTACHNLTGNGIAIGNADYPAAMRDVAAVEKCPLVDMTLATKTLVEQYGQASAKSIIYISTDNTHLQPMGATLFAQLVAQGLAALGILSTSLNPALDLIVTPSTWTFGAITTMSPASTSTTAQRLSITTPTVDAWPSELDVNAQRFVEFDVSPSAGKTLYVDGISLYAGADGGANMAFRIQYSKQGDFTAATEIFYSPSNVAGVVNRYTFGPLVAVNSGETLTARWASDSCFEMPPGSTPPT
jgi:lysophospholipase L1-like esterase